MDRFMETRGAWEDNGGDPMETLAERAAEHSGRSRELAAQTFRSLVDKGCLHCDRRGGLVCWEWVDYL
jgi:hypothetical protein